MQEEMLYTLHVLDDLCQRGAHLFQAAPLETAADYLTSVYCYIWVPPRPYHLVWIIF